MVAFAWTDQFLVPEGSRIYWLVARLFTAAILSVMFFANKLPSGGSYSQVYAYVGALLCTGVILAMNIRLGDFPSSHYAAIIIIVAGLCLVTWDARNTLIIGATAVSAWHIVNFAWRAPFDAEAFGFHAGYLGTGLIISTVVSHGRQRLTIQMLEQRKGLAEAVAKREALARQTAHDIRSPVAAIQVVCGNPTLCEDERLLLRDAMGRVNDIANNLVSYQAAQQRTPTSQPVRPM